jgi:hypothetical protein
VQLTQTIQSHVAEIDEQNIRILGLEETVDGNLNKIEEINQQLSKGKNKTMVWHLLFFDI